HEARQLGFGIGVDHDHAIHPRHAARLEEQGHVPDDDTLVVFLLEDGEDALLAHAYGRMRDLLEPLALGGVGEDDRAEGLAVQAPVLLEDGRAELLDDLRVGGLAGHDDLPRQQIGVDHARAQVREHLADRALARGDAAREADEQEAPHACSQSAPVLMSTLSGTSRAMADSITSRVSASSRASSSSGASKSNSSWTCRSIRALKPPSARALDRKSTRLNSSHVSI